MRKRTGSGLVGGVTAGTAAAIFMIAGAPASAAPVAFDLGDTSATNQVTSGWDFNSNVGTMTASNGLMLHATGYHDAGAGPGGTPTANPGNPGVTGPSGYTPGGFLGLSSSGTGVNPTETPTTPQIDFVWGQAITFSLDASALNPAPWWFESVSFGLIGGGANVDVYAGGLDGGSIDASDYLFSVDSSNTQNMTGTFFFDQFTSDRLTTFTAVPRTGNFSVTALTAVPMPGPATMGLAGLGGLAMVRRRRQG